MAVFEGARIIDGNGGAPIEDGVMLVQDGRVAAVGARGSVTPPAGALRVNLAGKTIIPALINVHTHMGYEGYTSWGAPNPVFSNSVLAPSFARATTASTKPAWFRQRSPTPSPHRTPSVASPFAIALLRASRSRKLVRRASSMTAIASGSRATAAATPAATVGPQRAVSRRTDARTSGFQSPVSQSTLATSRTRAGASPRFMN